MERVLIRLCESRIHKCIDFVIEKSSNEELLNSMKTLSSTLKTFSNPDELYVKVKEFMVQNPELLKKFIEGQHIPEDEVPEDELLSELLLHRDTLMMEEDDTETLMSYLNELMKDL